MGNSSNIVNESIKTLGNNGEVYRVKANFSYSLDADVYQRWTCFFVAELIEPPRLVINTKNQQCSSTLVLDRRRRRLRVMEDEINETNNNETDGNETNNETNETNETEEEEIDYIPDYNEYSIYILPSDRLEIDEVAGKISNINTDKEQLIEETYNKITGIPTISGITNAENLGQSEIIPELNLDELEFIIKNNSIRIKNLKLNCDGFIYATVEKFNEVEQDAISAIQTLMIDNLTDTNELDKTQYYSLYKFQNWASIDQSFQLFDSSGFNISSIEATPSLMSYIESMYYYGIMTPTFYQLRNSLNTSNLTSNYTFQQQLYQLNDRKRNFTFNNLTNNTYYKIFVIASVENPSYFARHTECVTLIQKTLVTVESFNSTDSGEKFHHSVIMICFVLIFIIILNN